MDFIEKKNVLVSAVFGLTNVRSIGQTGDVNEIPKAGESDIDLFVLCDEIPDINLRETAYRAHEEVFSSCRMQVCEGSVWGTGDVLIVEGVEVMFMYFTVREMRRYIDEVLVGKRLLNEGDFYPTGRVATIRNMHVLYDESGDYRALKNLVQAYPDELAKKLFEFHAERSIDEEDFGRALRRKDVLFYHQVLENALDHYLQALFAINCVYFPSRKRTEQYIDSFRLKPADCYARIKDAIRKGSDADTLAQSIEEWHKLLADLVVLETRLDK